MTTPDMTTPDTTAPAATPRRGRLIRRAGILAALLVPLGAALLPAQAAVSDDGATGWIRLAHLSPDTKSVDVRLSAVGGGDTLFELDGVTYGAVSPYTTLADGVYTVTMVPAGAAADSDPVLTTSVDVTAGRAATVAAYGSNDDLEVKIFEDDLATPTAGTARVRLIQASTETTSVDVQTSTGLPIAADATTGSATGYAEVPAGPWTLELSGKGVADQAAVDLADGSVSTLLVLDTADGGLTIMPVLDSAAVGQIPVGSVFGGGGGTADTGLIAELESD